MLGEKKKFAINIPIVIFIIASIAFIFSADIIEQRSQDESYKILEEAVLKAAVHCYAIEGQYPESIDYLEQNYGLSYNKNKYTVHYECIGSNIVPEIFVVRSGPSE